MIVYNIQSFLTVVGFFTGLFFSVIATVSPLELVVNAIISTLGFHAFANIALSFYVKNLEVTLANKFPKQALESELDQLVRDLDKKEDKFMPQKENFQIIINKQINNIEAGQKNI